MVSEPKVTFSYGAAGAFQGGVRLAAIAAYSLADFLRCFAFLSRLSRSAVKGCSLRKHLLEEGLA